MPFLPQDANLTSTGVIKVPDALGKNGKPDQLGLLRLLHTDRRPRQGPDVGFPRRWTAPLLWLTAYHGDLGIDAGIAQNVYQLDTTHMKQFTAEHQDRRRTACVLAAARTSRCRTARASLTFDGVKTWASFTISHQAGNEAALVSGACRDPGPGGVAVHPAPPDLGAGAAAAPDGITRRRAGRPRPQRVRADRRRDSATWPCSWCRTPRPPGRPGGPDRAPSDTDEAEHVEHAENAGDQDDPATTPPPTSLADDEGARA